MPVTIAVDAMGGDHGLPVTISASLKFLENTPDARVILVGPETALTQALARSRSPARDRVTMRAATEVVTMDEPPADALRKKKDSSMRVAINLVKDGTAQACVSAGNTGALMAIARFVLKTLPGIDRPAIASQLPSKNGETTVLDLGANVNCTPQQLVQFAAMGSALVTAVDGIERPTIGLLNIGAEAIKGNDVVKQTAELLKSSALNFVGNVMLKACEGFVTMLYDYLRAEFTRNPLTKLAALVAYPVLAAFRRRIDPRRYNGATLVGLKGIVVKSHGGADALAFRYALQKAYTEATAGVLDRIARQIAAMPAHAAPAQAAADAVAISAAISASDV